MYTRVALLLILALTACGGRTVSKKGVSESNDLDNNVAANNVAANNVAANNVAANNVAANNVAANNVSPNNSIDPCEAVTCGTDESCVQGACVPDVVDCAAASGPDFDGDGFGMCDDCCDSPADGCAAPAAVHPTAFDFAGDGVDNDCSGAIDDVPSCSAPLAWSGSSALELAAAMGVCGESLVAADLTAMSTGTASHPQQVAVAARLGGRVPAPHGPSMAILSSGTAAGNGDPGFTSNFDAMTQQVPGPDAYVAAHGGTLPQVGTCEAGNAIYDAVRLRLTLRAPTNAEGFAFQFRFFSEEYPTWVCTQFNDYFLVLVDGAAPEIPADGNVALDPYGNPITVNSDIITTCEPAECGDVGCGGVRTCSGGQCIGSRGNCPDGAADLTAFTSEGAFTSAGGGSSWLRTTVPVVPGEVFTVDFHIWDTGDSAFNSSVLLDGFEWLAARPSVATSP